MSRDRRVDRRSEAAAALEEAGESVGDVRGQDRLEGNHADRRSEERDLEEEDETFDGVRDGRHTAAVVSTRLGASRDGVEGFERGEGEFGCDLAAERPYLGGAEGVNVGLAVLDTDEDRNS